MPSVGPTLKICALGLGRRSRPSYADDGRVTCTFALPKSCSKEQIMQSVFDFTILISLLS